MTNKPFNPHSNIIWVDSNPDINKCVPILVAQQWSVACFHETADALNALRQNILDVRNIECVITSMMERDGRKERGCLNGLQMLDQIRVICQEVSIKEKPVFAVISTSADVKECKKHQVDIIVFRDYGALQLQIIDALKKRRQVFCYERVILIGIAGPSGCGKTSYAEHLARRLRSPFLPISLDSFFKNPIKINHPVLGRIKSLEDPTTIKTDAFLHTLQQIKRNWEKSSLHRSNLPIDDQKPIFIVIEGFLLFALSNDITSMFNIRIFLKSTLERCRLQRYRREAKINHLQDDSSIVVDPDFARWYDNLVWPEYLKRRDQQVLHAEKVFMAEEYANRNYEKLDSYMDEQLQNFVKINVEEIDSLGDELDEIDHKYGNTAKLPSDPFYNQRVREKHKIANRIRELVQTVDDSFSLSSHLLSPSNGHQTVAVHWIRFKQDSSHLNVLCYMLLNSDSNFLRYFILGTLGELLDQCDNDQLQQIKKTLLLYNAAAQTGQRALKSQLLVTVESLINFSTATILPNSYWWRDIESKFFNSLSGIKKYRLHNLHIIRNKHLLENFTRCRHAFKGKNEVLFVYHGSSPECLRAIAKDGFLQANDHSQTKSKSFALDQGYFGRGIYHGFAADYAILYSERYRNSNEILLSMVLPGKSYIVQKGGEKFGSDCEKGFDSHISPEKKEIVFFRSEQILPLFIIEFQLRPHSEIVEEQL